MEPQSVTTLWLVLANSALFMGIPAMFMSDLSRMRAELSKRLSMSTLQLESCEISRTDAPPRPMMRPHAYSGTRYSLVSVTGVSRTSRLISILARCVFTAEPRISSTLSVDLPPPAVVASCFSLKFMRVFVFRWIFIKRDN